VVDPLDVDVDVGALGVHAEFLLGEHRQVPAGTEYLVTEPERVDLGVLVVQRARDEVNWVRVVEHPGVGTVLADRGREPPVHRNRPHRPEDTARTDRRRHGPVDAVLLRNGQIVDERLPRVVLGREDHDVGAVERRLQRADRFVAPVGGSVLVRLHPVAELGVEPGALFVRVVQPNVSVELGAPDHGSGSGPTGDSRAPMYAIVRSSPSRQPSVSKDSIVTSVRWRPGG